MKKINNDKSNLFKIFEKYGLKKFSINELANFFEIHVGTIKRWIKLKEVPSQYFIELNKLSGYKYTLDISEKEHFKLYDQFYTNPKEAKRLIDISLKFIKKNWNINLNDYTLIEPSAGNGSFFNNFPKNFNKIGMDLFPQSSQILKQDFFNFIPSSHKNIVIGNPPFGLRGLQALKFINKASNFADFICFVLPPLFNSNGKGSPMLRVKKDLYLAKEFEVNNIFFYPNGQQVTVNAIFQIWSKIPSFKIKPIIPKTKQSEWIKVYALSNGNSPSSKRNVKMIGKCDFYLPSTTFQDINLVNKFDDLPNKRGYGIIILKDKNKIKQIMSVIDWKKISFKSTNGANNLRSQLIIDAFERFLFKDV